MAIKASELMQQMMDAGAPMEAVVIALRAIEDAQAEIEAKRAAARDRKRRQRAKERDGECDEGVTVTGQSQDSHEDTPLSRPLSPQTPQTPTHTPVDNTPARKADKFPMPEFCRDEQTWRDFKQNRKAKRLPCTPSAHAKLIRDVHKLADEEWPPWRVFDEIVARGWGAAYEFRDDRKPRNDHRKQPNSGRNTAELAMQKLGHRQ